MYGESRTCASKATTDRDSLFLAQPRRWHSPRESDRSRNSACAGASMPSASAQSAARADRRPRSSGRGLAQRCPSDVRNSEARPRRCDHDLVGAVAVWLPQRRVVAFNARLLQHALADDELTPATRQAAVDNIASHEYGHALSAVLASPEFKARGPRLVDLLRPTASCDRLPTSSRRHLTSTSMRSPRAPTRPGLSRVDAGDRRRPHTHERDSRHQRIPCEQAGRFPSGDGRPRGNRRYRRGSRATLPASSNA